MKKSMKFSILSIPGKIKIDLRVVDNDEISSEYIGVNNDLVSLVLYPLVIVSIVRPYELSDDGIKRKGVWNPNDSLPLTKYNVGVFLKELKEINNDMKIKELYNYFNERLELNEDVGEKIVRKFKVGNNCVELTPVVISLLDDSRVEGVKLKINNEESTVLLTLNDLEAVIYVLDHLDINTIAFMLFNRYSKGNVKNDRISEGDRSSSPS